MVLISGQRGSQLDYIVRHIYFLMTLITSGGSAATALSIRVHTALVRHGPAPNAMYRFHVVAWPRARRWSKRVSPNCEL